MKEYLALVIAIIAVCWMIRSSYRRKKLPPKAQLVCDIWKWANTP